MAYRILEPGDMVYSKMFRAASGRAHRPGVVVKTWDEPDHRDALFSYRLIRVMWPNANQTNHKATDLVLV